MNTFHVGEVKKILIGHDRKELGSGWYLDNVVLNDLKENVSYKFKCERWLSSRDGDGKTARELDLLSTRVLQADELKGS